jgi:hypothetical protein
VHRFVPDPLAATPRESTLAAEQLTAIKTLVRRILTLPADCPVIVSDSPCIDPGCPVLETVIAVFPAGGAARHWRFARPRAALTRTMLVQALTQPDAAESLDAAANLAP